MKKGPSNGWPTLDSRLKGTDYRRPDRASSAAIAFSAARAGSSRRRIRRSLDLHLLAEARGRGADGTRLRGEALGVGLYVEGEPRLLGGGKRPRRVGQLVAEHLRLSRDPTACQERDALRVGRAREHAVDDLEVQDERRLEPAVRLEGLDPEAARDRRRAAASAELDVQGRRPPRRPPLPATPTACSRPPRLLGRKRRARTTTAGARAGFLVGARLVALDPEGWCMGCTASPQHVTRLPARREHRAACGWTTPSGRSCRGRR
jgi:hypothetical protein